MKSETYLRALAGIYADYIRKSPTPYQKAQSIVAEMARSDLEYAERETVKRLIIEALETPDGGPQFIRKDASAKAYLQMMSDLRALLGGS